MKDQREVLRQSWISRHTGQGAKKAPVVLAGGMKLHQLTLSSEDAQLIATRGLGRGDLPRVRRAAFHDRSHREDHELGQWH